MSWHRRPDYQLGAEEVSQESLLDDVPKIGSRWQRVQGGYLGTVVKVRADRRTWVTVRYQEKLTDLTLENFRLYWREFVEADLDGSMGIAP